MGTSWFGCYSHRVHPDPSKERYPDADPVNTNNPDADADPDAVDDADPDIDADAAYDTDADSTGGGTGADDDTSFRNRLGIYRPGGPPTLR